MIIEPVAAVVAVAVAAFVAAVAQLLQRS